MLEESLLAFNYCMVLISLSLIVADNSCLFVGLKNDVVSSANDSEERTFGTEAIPVMCNKKSKGPNIDSYGTPYAICLISDVVWLKLT